MNKRNLPVLILKDIILFPKNEIKIEFSNDLSMDIINSSEMFHSNNVLIVNAKNIIEETININDLPKIGVVGKFKNKIVLPDGKMRVTIHGLNRAIIKEYLHHSSEILEAIITDIEEESDEKRIPFIIEEIKEYFKTVTYTSNDTLEKIKQEKSLINIINIVVPTLKITIARKKEYLYETNIKNAYTLLLEDVHNEMLQNKLEKK
ncbi:MAG: LON peptidase substrate-binding domain-containing protein [Bacilli bacterium]|nr:LON peptidase substrate-binding domain-containing protein [Bacilli bacterium]